MRKERRRLKDEAATNGQGVASGSDSTPSAGGATASGEDGTHTDTTAASAASAPAAAEDTNKTASPAKSSEEKPSGGGTEDEGEGGEDDDDENDDDDGEAAKPAAVPEEEAGTEEVEVTRWSEKGVGQLRLLAPKFGCLADGQADPAAGGPPPCPRLVMRVEHVGRLILNEPLRPTTAPAERVSETSIRLVVVSAQSKDEQPQIQSYLFRVKTPAEAEALINQINNSIPSSS